MRSTCARGLASACGRWWLAGLLVGGLLVARVPAADTSMADTVMPRPAALERDVRFWVRVYTEIDTNSGFLHDQYNLGVVYQTLHFPPDTSSSEREDIVDDARERIQDALRRIAFANGGPLSPGDQRIKALWGAEGTPARLLKAVDDVRFQLGQSDRFRAGLIRSGAWEDAIARTLARMGLPPELAVLPHVESSFDPNARSKVGAAGLWQFMRSTGRRYMRIDGAVDDRLDPFISTEAAAQLLSYNYRLLGTWPLALTAYNHGAAGMRRAEEAMGTDDIVKIVRHYTSPTFGFASRNFYVSFLAALQIDRDPEKYFGPIQKLPEERFQQVAVPGYVSIRSLLRAVRVDRDILKELNPALLRSVWEGRRRVPRDYLLRLPVSGIHWTEALLAQRLRGGGGPLYASQPQPQRYRVRRGDTIAILAERYGVTAERLARANHLRTSARLRVGRRIIIPEPQGGELVASTTSVPTVPAVATGGVDGGRSTVVADAGKPAGTPSSVDSSSLYVVGSDDSISEIASKFGMSEDKLLQLNRIRDEDDIFEGQELVVRPPPAAAAQPAPAPALAMSQSPGAAPSAALGEEAGGGVTPDEAEREEAEDAQAAASSAADENAQPVSAAQVDAPSLGPPSDSQQNPDPTDYSISPNGTIRVAAAETLGYYADWLDVSAAHLRRLNRMRRGRPVLIGHRMRLDFRHVSRAQFEAERRKYHEDLQATYFAAHRIIGTQVYVARRGDSLWTVTKRFSQVPIWLVQQYNPDTDLSNIRPGTQIVMPRVEAVSSEP